jgi:hypothetical protein
MATAAAVRQTAAQKPARGGVYLIAFFRDGRHVAYGSDDPRGKALHYCGWAQDVAARLAEHRRGQGGRLPRAVMLAGYELRLVRVWPGRTRAFERAVKNRHRLAEVCPVCAYRLGDDPSPVTPAKASTVGDVSDVSVVSNVSTAGEDWQRDLWRDQNMGGACIDANRGWA